MLVPSQDIAEQLYHFCGKVMLTYGILGITRWIGLHQGNYAPNKTLSVFTQHSCYSQSAVVSYDFRQKLLSP